MFDIPLWAKAAILAAILGAAVAIGHQWGAAGVQNDWDAAKLAAADAMKADEKKAAAIAAQHEKEMAALRAQIRKNQREVYDAANSNKYRGCVADDSLVGLWRKSYLPQTDPAK